MNFHFLGQMFSFLKPQAFPERLGEGMKNGLRNLTCKYKGGYGIRGENIWFRSRSQFPSAAREDWAKRKREREREKNFPNRKIKYGEAPTRSRRKGKVPLISRWLRRPSFDFWRRRRHSNASQIFNCVSCYRALIYLLPRAEIFERKKNPSPDFYGLKKRNRH